MDWRIARRQRAMNKKNKRLGITNEPGQILTGKWNYKIDLIERNSRMIEKIRNEHPSEGLREELIWLLLDNSTALHRSEKE